MRGAGLYEGFKDDLLPEICLLRIELCECNRMLIDIKDSPNPELIRGYRNFELLRVSKYLHKCTARLKAHTWKGKAKSCFTRLGSDKSLVLIMPHH